MSKKMKMKKRKDLLSLLDFVFVLGQNDGNEGYAYAYNQNGGMMFVSESSAKGDLDGSPVAYHASRIAAGTMDAMFQLASNRSFSLNEQTLPIFREEYEVALHKNMVENFEEIPPVSYTALLLQCEQKKLRSAYMTSEGVKLFFLGKDGLILITPEHIDPNKREAFFTCPLPGLLLCVSDSCSARFDGPMDFEYTVLDALCDSQTVEGFKSLLTKKIKAEGTDSFLMSVAGFGFSSFKSLNKMLSNRKSNLYWNVLSKETTATPYEAEAMANAYNKVYLSYQPDFDTANFTEGGNSDHEE